MADYNIQMEQRNAANIDWDNLYPLTKAVNVKANDGTDIEAHVNKSSSTTVKGHIQLATTAEATAGTDTAKAVTPAGVKSAIDALIGAAPGALNTLDELANALGDDPNFRTTILNAIADKVSQATFNVLSQLFDTHSTDSDIHVSHSYIDDADVINAINIAKTNFKLDAHTGASINDLESLVIDVLNDSTGINAGASQFDFDSVNKNIKVGLTDASISGVNGAAISGGDFSDKVKDNVYDNNNSTYWQSTQTYTGISGNAYIGFAFTQAIEVRKIEFMNYQTAARCPSSLKLQYADDDNVWHDVATISPNTGADAVNSLYINENVPHKKWRLLANANLGSTGLAWQMRELNIYTPIEPSTVVWHSDSADSAPNHVYVVADTILNNGTVTFYISRDGGNNWTQIPQNELTDISTQPSGTTILLKAVLTEDAEITAVAWGWKQ